MIVNRRSCDQIDRLIFAVVADDHPPPVVVVPKPILDPFSLGGLNARHVPPRRRPPLKASVEFWISAGNQALQQASETVFQDKLCRGGEPLESFMPSAIVPRAMEDPELRQPRPRCSSPAPSLPSAGRE